MFIQSLITEIFEIGISSEEDADVTNIIVTIMNIDKKMESLQRQEAGLTVPQQKTSTYQSKIDMSPAALYTLLDDLPAGKTRQRLLRRFSGSGYPFRGGIGGDPWRTLTETFDEHIYRPGREDAIALMITPPSQFLLGLLGKARCVRPAIHGDIPSIQEFFSNHFNERFDNPSRRCIGNYWESVESLINFRWRSIFEGVNPLIIAISDKIVVGVAMVWAERLVEIFIDPAAENHFFAVLLHGIIERSRVLGLNKLEAEVIQADGPLFELAGWQRPSRAVPSARWCLPLLPGPDGHASRPSPLAPSPRS